MYYKVLQAYNRGLKFGTIAKMYGVELQVVINMISTTKATKI